MNERVELLIRIAVAIVSGAILGVWRMAVVFVVVFHWLIVLFTGKRNAELAEFAEIWNTQWYFFVRYIILVSNKRPFPFTSIAKNISSFGDD